MVASVLDPELWQPCTVNKRAPGTQSAGGIAGRLLSLCLLGAGSMLLDPSDARPSKTSGGGHEMKAGFTSPFAHKRNASRGAGELAAAESDVLDPVSVLVALDPKQV